MSHCLSVTETLCSSSPAIKANPEFSKYLSMSMEMYFALLDDQDSGRVYPYKHSCRDLFQLVQRIDHFYPTSDVRMTADDALSRAVKNLVDTNVGRLQVSTALGYEQRKQ